MLSFVAAPNFEAPTDAGLNNIYDVIVQTSDGTLSASQAIAVTVTNVNEAPIITSNGGGTTASISIAENGTAVTTVIGSDPDAATTLTYSIIGGADAAKFAINASTGALSFHLSTQLRDPDRCRAATMYTMSIVQTSDGSLTASQAHRRHGDRRQRSSDHHIEWRRRNGFDQRSPRTATAVTTVVGSDQDTATTLTYSIVGGADASKFTIDASTGALSFVSAPPTSKHRADAGGNNVYDVIVQTSDGSLTASQAIAVTVYQRQRSARHYVKWRWSIGIDQHRREQHGSDNGDRLRPPTPQRR